jgi:hypothetical protein
MTLGTSSALRGVNACNYRVADTSWEDWFTEDGVVGEAEIKPIAVVEKMMEPRNCSALWRS